jgi:NAD(P)-dependent dehydrogenase (short-subunit alcohol dehydrogenase family)
MRPFLAGGEQLIYRNGSTNLDQENAITTVIRLGHRIVKSHPPVMAPFPSPTSKWHTTAYASILPTRSELFTNGKTVIVTGGGTGIGAETARSFAQAGASRIALLGRREQPLLDTKASIMRRFPDVEVFVASTDITKKSEVDIAFTKFVGEGKVDVVVSNAGIMGPAESVKDADEHEFLEAIQQSIRGSLFVAQAFVRHAASDAVAINVSSSAAHLNFGPGFASYSIAKLAAFRIWDSLGFAYPELRVFHTQPGVVNTALNKELGGAAAFGFEDHSI